MTKYDRNTSCIGWSLTDKTMGKNHHNKGGGARPPNPQPHPHPQPQQVKVTQKTPAATPSAPSGSAGNPKTISPKSIYPLTQKPFQNPNIAKVGQKANVATPMAPTGTTSKPTASFVIPAPKGGEKRARDPSLNSKGSERSNAPPPQKRTYADATAAAAKRRLENRPDYAAYDSFWPANQLRIFKNTRYYEPISFQEFVDLRAKLNRETFRVLREDINNRTFIELEGTFFNKTLHCGVINCLAQSLSWFKDAVSRVSEGEFRGWTKDELVTTCVKIFVPSGLENLTIEEYVDATRMMFETEETQGFPWIIIRDYVHHARQNRMIIAQIPEAAFNHIKSRGRETGPGSGVWKANGFMAPLKLAVASSSDVNIRTPNNTNSQHELPSTQTTSNTSNTSPPSSLPSSPKPLPEPAVEEPFGLLFEEKDPLLSTCMSPLRKAMEDTHVTNSQGETDGQEEEMDLNLLAASPTQSDPEEISESWADQC